MRLLLALALALAFAKGTHGPERIRRNICTQPEATDGDTCSDGNPMTRPDRCRAGVCLSGPCTAVFVNNQCQSACPPNKIRDGSFCVDEQRQCGSQCIECDESGTGCSRCAFEKVLDGSSCSDTCTVKANDGSDKIRVTPKGRFCEPIPVEPSKTFFTDDVVLYFIIGGGALGLLLLITLVCCCRESCHKRNFDIVQDTTPQSFAMGGGDSIAMQPVTVSVDGTHNEESRAEPESIPDDQPEVTERDKELWKATMRRATSKSKALQNVDQQADATTEHLIDSAPTTTLPPDQAQHVYRELDRMRSDRNTYAVILKEMQVRRDATSDGDGRQKYDVIVADLTRLLRLFRQDESDTTVPVDSMALLEWSQKMMDKYLTAKAARAERKKQKKRNKHSSQT